MKKRARFIFVLATVLAVGLWVSNKYLEQQQVSVIEENELAQWGDVVPLFRNQKVSEFYIIRPQEHRIDRVMQGSEAQILLDEIGKYPSPNNLNAETEIGFMLEVEGERFSFYIPHNGEPERIEETKQKTKQALENSLDLVDVYSLIPPSQITSIQFVGCNAAANGDFATRRALSLETADQEVISKVMQVLQRVTVTSLVLQDENHRMDLSGIQESDGYHMIIRLGDVYENHTIEVFGSRYGFTMDIGFQWNQRFYTTEYGAIKGMLDALEALEETEVTALTQSEASPSPLEEKVLLPEERQNKNEGKEASPPRLPEDDFIPLPEGLHVLGD